MSEPSVEEEKTVIKVYVRQQGYATISGIGIKTYEEHTYYIELDLPGQLKKLKRPIIVAKSFGTFLSTSIGRLTACNPAYVLLKERPMYFNYPFDTQKLMLNIENVYCLYSDESRGELPLPKEIRATIMMENPADVSTNGE
jgi:hypothetical protein